MSVAPQSVDESISSWGQCALLYKLSILLVSIIVDMKNVWQLYQADQTCLLEFDFQLLLLTFKRSLGLFQLLLLCLKIHSFCSLMLQSLCSFLPKLLYFRSQCVSVQLEQKQYNFPKPQKQYGCTRSWFYSSQVIWCFLYNFCKSR